jgi:hypothetical protein
MDFLEDDKSEPVTKERLINIALTESNEDITCKYCGSMNLTGKKSDLHGYGVWCGRCKRHLFWTGKGSEKKKKNNPKFRKQHKKEGLLVCEWCGIDESEAKKMGQHFTIDHVIAEDFGGEDNFDNSRPICSACHYLKTALEHRTRGIKKILGSSHE